jgi:hypothetical protein
VTTPERALEAARAAAAERRDAGEYPAGGETTIEPLSEAPPSYRRLLEWALIDPDIGDVRSTRRWGAPITAAKRGLLRLLAQYHAELIAEQTRFNVNLVHYLRALEQRIEQLEQERER